MRLSTGHALARCHASRRVGRSSISVKADKRLTALLNMAEGMLHLLRSRLLEELHARLVATGTATRAKYRHLISAMDAPAKVASQFLAVYECNFQ
jgi:hypothetical protein